MEHAQRGMTLLGLLFFLAIFVVVAYFLARLVPDYMDYYAVKRIVAELQTQASQGTMTDAELRKVFAKQLNVDYVKVLEPRDLVIQRDRRKGVNLYVEWSAKKPFVGNISLCADFKAGEPLPK